MKLTERDIRLIKDIALSHVLSRDQIIRLGYFTSISRTNRRLKVLVDQGFVRVHSTPFFGQNLYWVGPAALSLVSDRIRSVLKGRVGTPRFLQHSLVVTEVRLALLAQGGDGWRFEAQLWSRFKYGGRQFEIRPDGYLLIHDQPAFIEVDRGLVSPQKFGEKLRAYSAFAQQNGPVRLWVVTTTSRRIASLTPSSNLPLVSVQFVSFAELGLGMPGGWS